MQQVNMHAHPTLHTTLKHLRKGSHEYLLKKASPGTKQRYN